MGSNQAPSGIAGSSTAESASGRGTHRLAGRAAVDAGRSSGIGRAIAEGPVESGVQLASRLGDPLPPTRVADLMMMWTLPPDVSLTEPVLMPARRRPINARTRRGQGRG